MAPRSPLSDDAKRELLARVPLFRGFSALEFDALLPSARTRDVKAREEIFHKGDEGAQLYVVVEGRVKALTTSVEGDDVVFNVMGPGEVFGEVALVSEGPRTATVRAIDRGRLLVLDRRDFMAFLKQHPEVAVSMLGLLAERLVRASEFVEEIQFLKLPVRLAKKLTSLAESYGQEQSDGSVKIDLKLSQEEWGDLVGTTRESINKQMRTWAEEGLARIEGGTITVLNPKALERLAFSTF